eukprot:12421908-Karenia_brevis.AAC.1
MQRWLRGMKGRKWGDNVAVQALADELLRPIIVWRMASPEQLPTCCPCQGMSPDSPVQPIYLMLDERRRGSEHYNARIRTPSMPSAGNAACPQHQPEAECPSSKSLSAAANAETQWSGAASEAEGHVKKQPDNKDFKTTWAVRGQCE